MNKLKIAYFGTPDFSARFLEKLLTDTSIKRLIEVEFVLTQADKPVGKKKILTPSPVKEMGKKYKIKVYDQDVKDIKDEIKKLDFVLIYAYGFKQFIPADILSLPKIKFSNTNSGFINIHPSLLPLYRGASPIAYPLMLGDKKTGVSFFVLDEKMDHGPIVTQEGLDIKPSDMRSDLEKKLTDLGFEMFKKLVINNDSGVSRRGGIPRMTPKPQDHSKATHARFLTKDDGFINLQTLKMTINDKPLKVDETPKIINEHYKKNKITIQQFNNSTIYNMFRGLYPWPGIWTIISIKGQNKRLKIIGMSMNHKQLTINKVQLEGKKEVDFKTFNSAYSVF